MSVRLQRIVPPLSCPAIQSSERVRGSFTALGVDYIARCIDAVTTRHGETGRVHVGSFWPAYDWGSGRDALQRTATTVQVRAGPAPEPWFPSVTFVLFPNTYSPCRCAVDWFATCLPAVLLMSCDVVTSSH